MASLAAGNLEDSRYTYLVSLQHRLQRLAVYHPLLDLRCKKVAYVGPVHTSRRREYAAYLSPSGLLFLHRLGVWIYLLNNPCQLRSSGRTAVRRFYSAHPGTLSIADSLEAEATDLNSLRENSRPVPSQTPSQGRCSHLRRMR
jgi:hypothetical protein